MAAQIEWLLRELEFGYPDPRMIQNAVLDLLAQIRTHFSRPPAAVAGREGTRRRHRRVAEATRRYIEFHLGESLSLEEIAKAVGASPYHLCRIFREQTGITLHTYRTRQRLGRAIQVLMNDRVESLTDLALDLGFSSHSHLTRAFRDELGVPPSALRSCGKSRPPIPVAAPFP
ncbi:MAG: AraC family transcriptional regulator [Pseudomonadota bacterium]